MRPGLVCLLAFPVLCFAAADGGSAEYVGGTVTVAKGSTDGAISATNEEHFVFRTGKRELHVPYDRINLLEYGQNVSRRYAMAVLISPIFVLSKSRKHFLTIGFTDDDGKQQAMVFRVDGGKIRMVLASLEARTGVRVEFQDEEARRAGKG